MAIVVPSHNPLHQITLEHRITPPQIRAAGVKFQSDLASWLHAHGREPEPTRLPENMTGLLGRLYRDGGGAMVPGGSVGDGSRERGAQATSSGQGAGGCPSPLPSPSQPFHPTSTASASTAASRQAAFVVAGVPVDRRDLEDLLTRQVCNPKQIGLDINR